MLVGLSILSRMRLLPHRSAWPRRPRRPPPGMMRSMRLRLNHILLALSPLALAGCPKEPPSDPVPADCTKPGQACAGKPAPEGPPRVGTQSPGPEVR